MKKLLLVGIVLAVCFVGTASDEAYITTTNSDMNFDAVVTLADTTTTLEWNGDGYLLDPRMTITMGMTECQHPKLKALGDNCWGNISSHEFCPTEYRQRAYKCRECKKEIVILQAIMIESKGETQ